MRVKHFFQIAVFLLAFIGCGNAFANGVPAPKAKEWSEEKGRALINLLAEEDIVKKHAELDDLFLNYIDLDYVARFVMGKYWKDMTEEQKEKYIPLFKRYSLALYKSFPLQFDKDRVNFVVNNVTVEKDYTLVQVNVTLKAAQKKQGEEDVNALVEFRLHEKDGAVKIMDLKITETSFLLTYRDRFYKMIHEDDGDLTWFLEDLETSTISTERNNQINVEKASK